MTAVKAAAKWTGLETAGMKEAKCSLLIQNKGVLEPKIKTLPKQRVRVYQDKAYNPAAGLQSDDDFYVDFNGCTVFQLEPKGGVSHKTMPITLTVGGQCYFTAENYHDFSIMMRTKEQSQDLNIPPNGNFDWPDVSAMMMCPLCGASATAPTDDDEAMEYWIVFYPMLQITVQKGSQLTLGTRTICRLTCFDCMHELMDGMTLEVQPPTLQGRRPKLTFTLPASEILAEAGTASFLEDGPPRPETHPHVDDLLDAWTLYNLWEHSGAWEALQNDYRVTLARTMHYENAASAAKDAEEPAPEARVKERLGERCGNPKCSHVHGKRDSNGEIIRLKAKCKECEVALYCGKFCRTAAKDYHQQDCIRLRNDDCHHSDVEEEPKQSKASRKVQCDTCKQRLPYTLMKKCSRCRNATYCSQECQKKDW